MLQALAGERGATGRGTDQETTGHLVTRRPQLVAGALEAEHRVEDVDRDEWLAVRRVCRSDRLEGRGGTRLVDAGMHDLAGFGLLVGEHQLSVDGEVVLAPGVEDLGAREDRVEPEGPRLVRDDRDQSVAELLVLHQLLEEPDEGHRGGDVLSVSYTHLTLPTIYSV